MSKQPFIIVVGTDYSEHSKRALLAALERARGEQSTELHVVHAVLAASPYETVPMAPVSGLGVLPVLSLEQQQAALVAFLDAQVELARALVHARTRVYAHVIIDSPSLAVTRLARELEADLIVIGTHGQQGVARWLLGSVAEGVVRQAACPVLVVPPPPAELVVPAIEPPCPRCVEARARPGSSELWCEQHRERHGRRHTYYQRDGVSGSNLPLVVHES
jgi:nucleotide-binding universal stress UspA family protein